jgi:hypothetical protein
MPTNGNRPKRRKFKRLTQRKKMAKAKWQVYSEITGPVIMIGFGSIGRGTLPLIERHFKFDKSRMVVIDPSEKNRKILDDKGIRFVKQAITKDNYAEVLDPFLKGAEGQAFVVNLSVDTGSVDLMHYSRKNGALYIDTVVEPWWIMPHAPIMRCVKPCWPKSASTPAVRPPSHAAAPIRAWCRGSSRKRLSIWRRNSSSTSPNRRLMTATVGPS